MGIKYDIIIVVDTNDADYYTIVEEVTEEELLQLKPLIEALDKFEPYSVEVHGHTWKHNHNYPYGEYSPRDDLGEKFPHELYPDVSPDVHELFHELVTDCYEGFHTVESITVCPVSQKTTLFKRK